MFLPFRNLANLTPRQRMVASLNGLVGTGGAAVEVRGQAGHFTQLIQNALDAPRVGSVITGGAYHAAGGRVGFGPNAVKSLFTPAVRTRENSSVQPGPDVVRAGVAGLLSDGTLTLDLKSRLTRSEPLPAPSTSRALLPDAPAPKYEGGQGVVDTTSASKADAASSAGARAQTVELAPPAPVTTRVDPAQLVDPAKLPVTAKSIPMWQLAVGGAALFGVIWYVTKEG